MEDRVARVYRFKKVLKYSILSLLITIVGLLVFEYFRIKPNNVYFTNITSSSITVSWDTKIKTDATAIYVDKDNKLPFVILPVFKDRFFDTRDITKAELKAAAQSSQNQDGLEVTMNDMVTNVSVTDRGKYYTHHVEIKGLEPETEYSFMVGDSIVFRKVKDVNNTTVAKTYAVPESILSPYPAYGAVRDAEGTTDVAIEELPIVDDGIVYFSYYEKNSDVRSNLFSSSLNASGNWYIDVSNAINSEGESFTAAYPDSEDSLFAELEINLGPKGIWKSINNPSIISPTDITVININDQTSNETGNYEVGDLFKISTKLGFSDSVETTALGVFKALAYSNCSSGTTCEDCDVPSCPSSYPLTGCPSGYNCNNTVVKCTKSCSSSGMPCGESTKTCYKIESSSSCTCTCSSGSKSCPSGATYGCSTTSASCSPSNCANVTCYVPNSAPKDCGNYKCDGGHVCPSGYSESKPSGNYIEEKKSCVAENDCGKTTSINYTCYKSTGSSTVTKESVDWVGYCGPCRWKYSDGSYGSKSMELCEKEGMDKLISHNCDGYSKNDGQENDKCQSYFSTTKVPVGTVELHDKTCRICAYKTTALGSQYAQWDDATAYSNINGVCKKGSGIDLACNINEIKEANEQCDPDASVTGCTGDLKCDNNCKCVSSLVDTDTCKINGQVAGSEQCDPNASPTGCSGSLTCNNSCICVESDETTPIDGSKSCWKGGIMNLEKIVDGITYRCKAGTWVKIDKETNCSRFLAGTINSCSPFQFCYDSVKSILYKCSLNSTFKEFNRDYSNTIAIEAVEKEKGQECNNFCICLSGASQGEFIHSGEVCPYKCSEKNVGKVCNTGGGLCRKNTEDSFIEMYGTYVCGDLNWDQSSSIFDFFKNNSLLSSLPTVYAEEITAEKYVIDQTTGLISGLEEGVYSFEVDGQTYFFDVSDEALAANNGNVLIYIDTNGNGQYDEGTDTKVSTLASEIEITTIQKNYKFNLKQGFNFVSFPFVVAYDEYKTAAALLKQLNDVYGDVIYSISRFDGAWKVVGQNVEIYDNNDFQLLPGQGYVIKAKEDVDIVIPGKPIKYESEGDKAPISLFPGWNLIGIYGNNVKTYTAKSILQDINAYEPVDFTANNVSKWESDTQKYDGFQLEVESGVEMEYGFDYTIDILKSYFVRVESGEGNWQPKLAE